MNDTQDARDDTATGLPDTMDAVVYRRYGPPEVLAVERLPRPHPGPGEVLIRNHAVAVTSADCSFRAADPAFARIATGLLRPRRPVLGVEMAGVVTGVGSGVERVRVGDRVVGSAGVGMGGYAEYVCLPAEAVAAVPDALSFADAVAVVEGGLTALPFLRDHAGLRAGQRILVNGAAGAVGSAAVQLAVHFGAEVTGVCSTANVEFVRSLGAARVIDRTTTDFTRSGTMVYDVVFDAAGKSSFRRSRGALTPKGRYLTTVPSLPALIQHATGRRVVLAFTGLRPAADKARDMALLTRLAAAGEIRAAIDRRWPLGEAVEAHRYVGSGRKRGAVVLDV
jgi:NADPH:quinone reductase-like Zn-dependent oxidoreductase